MGLFDVFKKNNNQNKINNVIKKQSNLFGEITFKVLEDKGKIETKIDNVFFCNKNIYITILVNQDSDIDNVISNIDKICSDSSKFINENYEKLAEYCNNIDLYDNDGTLIQNVDAEILKEIFTIKNIYVESNANKENLIEVIGRIYDDIEQEIAIIYNCSSNSIEFELL